MVVLVFSITFGQKSTSNVKSQNIKALKKKKKHKTLKTSINYFQN
jgi:hypothetical protein